MEKQQDKDIVSMRFKPYWDTNLGTQVCGLIELVYDIGIISNQKPLRCVEIGSHKGESALIISSFPFIKKLTCVDLCKYSEFQERLKQKIQYGVVDFVQASSIEYADLIENNSVDFVYIDAEHDYDSVKQDLSVWFPKVKIGGFLAGHDYNKQQFPGLVKAVWDFQKDVSESWSNKPMFLKTYVDSSYCFIKTRES
tara:strand:- start:3486 stop:4073 length:588 start_codon:yes stop_codon:yes gene_type:complete